MSRPNDTDDELQAALARSRLLVDAPEPVLQRALDIFSARRPAAVRRLTATLSFDSGGLAPQAVGVRSGGSDVRQVLFSADGRDIDLRISAEGSGWQISGQVLGPDAAGHAVLTGDGIEAETAWNELAEFSFDAVPAGSVTLTLRGDGWEMVLPALQIPDQR